MSSPCWAYRLPTRLHISLQARTSPQHLQGTACSAPCPTRSRADANSSRFNFSFPILNNLIVPIEIETWNVFDSNHQISQYDATFKWWQWTFNYLIQTAAAAQNMNLTQIEAYATDKLATSICSTAQTFCNGTNTQYNSTASCYNYLTTQIRFGEAYELG